MTHHRLSLLGLCLAVLLTAVLSLGVHEAMFQIFHFPYPDRAVMKSSILIPLMICFTEVVGNFMAYYLARGLWSTFSMWQRVGLFFLLNAMLNEDLLRGPIMSMIITKTFLFNVLGALPGYFSSLAMALCVVTFFGLTQSSFNNWKKILPLVVALIATTCVIFVARQAARDIMDALTPYVTQPNPQDIIMPPYPLHILVPSYILYLSPTVASFGLCWFIYQHGGLKWAHAFLFVLTLLLLKGYLAINILLTLYSSDHWIGFLSMSQFTGQVLVLGLLTATSLAVYKKTRERALVYVKAHDKTDDSSL